jgi:hypothetical protein
MKKTLLVVEDEPTILEDEVLEIVLHDLEGARESHDDQMDKISTWMDEYNGKPYGNEIDGRAAIVWRLIKKQGESLISNLIKPFVGNYDIVQIDPITEADVYKSKINEKLINHFWNKEMNPVRFMKQLCKVIVPEGTVFVRVGWENEYREKRERIPLSAFNDEIRQRFEKKGAKFEIDEEKSYVEIIVRKVLSNRPTVKVVRNEDIYLDPTADSFSDIKFLIYERRTTLSDIANDKAYDEKAVKALKKTIRDQDDEKTDGWDEHEYNTSDFEFIDESRKKVTLYEYWGYYDIDGDGKDEPIYAVIAKYGKSNVLIKMKKNPFLFNRPPFVCIPLYDNPFNPYGDAIAEAISDEQKVSTSIVRGMIDNMSESNNGMKFFKKGALDAVNFNRLKRGDKYIEINTTDSINTAILDGNFNQLPQHVYNMLNMLDMQAESLTGISKMMQGIPGSELKSSTSNFSAMMSQSQIRLLDITTNITNGLKEIFRMWLSMTNQYLDDDEIKRITGIDIPAMKQMETNRLAQQLKVNELPSDTAMKAMMLVATEIEDMFNRKDLKYDIRVKVGTDGLKQIKIQNINMLMQQIGPLVQMGNVPPDAVKLLVADLADNLDRPDVAQMINEYQPQPDPMAQMQAQLALQKMEAEAAKDKALAANAMARTENTAAKTKKELASMDADISNKYADATKKMAEVNQKDRELDQAGMEKVVNAAIKNNANAKRSK